MTTPAPPIRYDGTAVDLSPRLAFSKTKAADVPLAAEVIICQTPPLGIAAAQAGVLLIGMAAYTVGTSGVSGQLRIRRTNLAGAVVADTGAMTQAAASLQAPDIEWVDTAPTIPGQVYVLTLQIASGAAQTTVSAVSLIALVI